MRGRTGLSDSLFVGNTRGRRDPSSGPSGHLLPQGEKEYLTSAFNLSSSLTVPSTTLTRIAAVAPGERPLTLLICWSQGGEDLVDVSWLVGAFQAYAPLRADPDLFSKVRVGERGTDVMWGDDTDMAADTLWRLSGGD